MSRALQICRGEYADTAFFAESERVTVNGQAVQVAALLPQASAAS